MLSARALWSVPRTCRRGRYRDAARRSWRRFARTDTKYSKRRTAKRLRGAVVSALAGDPTGPGLDVVVSDIRMPVVGSLDIFERLLGEPHRPPLILIAAFPDGKTRLRAETLGAAMLEKPLLLMSYAPPSRTFSAGRRGHRLSGPLRRRAVRGVSVTGCNVRLQREKPAAEAAGGSPRHGALKAPTRPGPVAIVRRAPGATGFREMAHGIRSSS